MAKENTIQDFGEKIGGAKKDLWKSRGLGIADIIEWNDAEKEKYITKNNIWPTPDYEKLVDEGYSKTALYFIKVVKDSLPTKPQNYLSDKEESQKGFIEFITHCKEKLLEVKTENDIKFFNKSIFTETEYGQKFMSDYFGPKKKVERAVYRLNPENFRNEAIKKGFLFTYEDKIRNSIEKFNLNDSNVSIGNDISHGYNHERLRIDVKTMYGTMFLYTPETPPLNQRDFYNTHKHLLVYQHQIMNAFETAAELDYYIEQVVSKAVKEHEELENKKQEELANEPDKPKRKTKLVPPQLEHIQRTGTEVRTKTSIEGQDFLDDFKIKGGEFGNWLNELDRQTNMNFAYDSFKDLAIALDIKDEDVSLGNRLNIAFGARGSGSALAHYEPDREVINLTKMKGAGSLAHEYGHALDNIFSPISDYLSETPSYKVGEDKVCKAALQVVDAMTKGTATLEYSQEMQKKKIDEIHKSLQSEMDKFLRNKELTPEQEKKKETVMKNVFALLEQAKDNEEMKFAEISFLTKNKMKTDISDTLNEFNDFFRFHGNSSMNGIKYYQHNIEYFARKMDSFAGQLRFCKSPDYLVGTPIDSKFYADAKKIDDIHSKSGHGYWQSKCELFARAFACYVKDKLAEQGISNNYLTGHAEFPAIPTPSGLIYTYPIGEERNVINKAFDNLIEVMKEQELLHQREITISKEEPEVAPVAPATPKIEEYSFINDNKEYTVRLQNNEIIIDSPYEEQRKNISFSSPEKAEIAYKSMIDTIEQAMDSYENQTPDFDEEER